ncbi:peptidase [Microbacterium phage Schubert]|uniref:Lysin A n=1 Tax=Microbacterium phage Schubert TaxID=2500787 RepID=A0A3T0INY9_9CAUD|nr:peptidase [Microbacterium phage Schubert]AZV01731.1 lysin A [Microbacterium phage Schubert]
MPTWAPNTDRVVNTSWGRSRQGAAVTGIWVHHQADGEGHDSIDYMINWNSRGSHPTYAIDDNDQATVVGIIHPDYCPSSTGYSNDQSAITVEIANISGAPDWEVSQRALEELAQIIAHHAKESPRENRAEFNRPGVTQKGFWVGIHKQVMATACPGPFVERNIEWVINRANEIMNGSSPKPKPGKPANTPAAPGKAPAFPLPNGWYFGPRSGPVYSVSGYYSYRNELKMWQAQMQKRGWDFSRYGVDGLYGAETRENAIAFQKEKGLKVDGLIGPETWRAAWEAPIT